jgi:8 Dehydrogenases with different specificities (re lated to short-chain alcohol dehydrogenases)
MQRVALITGAARGLGEVIARRMHAAGYRVALGDLDFRAACAVADSLDPSGASAIGLALDVTDKSAFESALVALQARWGGTDVLVNNAGKSKVSALMDISPEEFDQVVAINLRGTFVGSQVFGAHFAQRGFGRIVNIGSLAGQSGGTATGAHYAAAKGGVAVLTKVFARELAAHGVTVNCVSPGPLDLPIVHETVPADRLDAIRRSIPVQRLGSPEYVADVVLLLAADAAGAVTGASWDANGGLLMR